MAASALPELLAGVELTAWAARVGELRHQLVAVLRGHGLEPRPSDANWVLVEAPGLRARLAPHGIVVRDCTSFGLPGMARIAVPEPGGIARLDEALSSIDGSGYHQVLDMDPPERPAPEVIVPSAKKGAT